jgi:hypothetical protein
VTTQLSVQKAPEQNDEDQERATVLEFFLEGLRKSSKNLEQDSPCSGRDSNRKLKYAGASLRRPEFKPRSGHMRFVVNNLALGQVSS